MIEHVLSVLRVRRAEAHVQRVETYSDFIAELAAGREIDAEAFAIVCDSIDATEEQITRDVNAKRDRLAKQAELAARRAEFKSLEGAIEEHHALTVEWLRAQQAYQVRLAESAQKQGRFLGLQTSISFLEDSLERACDCPVVLERERKHQERSAALNARRAELMNAMRPLEIEYRLLSRKIETMERQQGRDSQERAKLVRLKEEAESLKAAIDAKKEAIAAIEKELREVSAELAEIRRAKREA